MIPPGKYTTMLAHFKMRHNYTIGIPIKNMLLSEGNCFSKRNRFTPKGAYHVLYQFSIVLYYVLFYEKPCPYLNYFDYLLALCGFVPNVTFTFCSEYLPLSERCNTTSTSVPTV